MCETRSEFYKRELHNLAGRPIRYTSYSQCDMNGTKFVTHRRDQNKRTQNIGVMVVVDEITYYRIVEDILELNICRRHAGCVVQV